MDHTEEQTLSQKTAEFIKAKRIALGMTQKEFAVHLFDDVKHRPWVSRIENGRQITVETLGKIMKRLNADIEIIEY